MNNYMHYNAMACENETLRERYRAINQKAREQMKRELEAGLKADGWHVPE